VFLNVLVVLGLPCTEPGFWWAEGVDPPQLKVGRPQAQVGGPCVFRLVGGAASVVGCTSTGLKHRVLLLPVFLLLLLVLSSQVVVVTVLLNSQHLFAGGT
jgi:hypothetical protein